MHSSAFQRSANTYSSRRRLRHHSGQVPTTSPVKPAATLDNDTTLEEMSRRMRKRSRANLRGSQDAGVTQSDGGERSSPEESGSDVAAAGMPSKKRKFGTGNNTARIPLKDHKVDSNAPLMLTVSSGSNDEMDISMIKTPVARHPPTEPDTVKPPRESGSLSPLPSASHSKRILKTRASSKYLKENTGSGQAGGLLSANSLASPFHSQHTTPATSPRPSKVHGDSHTAHKNPNRSKLGAGRTRSAGSAIRRHSANRSGPSSPSITSGIHRRPSESNLHKSKQNWLVPVQPDEVLRNKVAYKPTRLNQSFGREGSFFEGTPLACSTPMHTSQKQRSSDATFRLPFNKSELIASAKADDSTPRASIFSRESIFSDHSASSHPPVDPRRNAGRRTTVHMPEDSIFSTALDFSTFLQDPPLPLKAARAANAVYDTIASHTKKEARNVASDKLSVTMAPPASPVSSTSTTSSDGGDELRDMFSILGLDEIGMSDAFSDPSEMPPPLPPSKRKSLHGEEDIGSSDLKPSVGGNAKMKSRVGRPHRASSVSQVRVRAPAASPVRASSGDADDRPTLRMKIHDTPIQPHSDSDDELLLTFKGWKYGNTD